MTALASTTAAIMVEAAPLEAMLPWPGPLSARRRRVLC